ncbi:integrase [Xanthomonas campestris]|uniref:integrase n=1 Tax=Xanthomonas campestris TaxID=339 RepID=UPI001EE6F660|nr:integrase [Xanthomonas campestris]
MKYTPKNNGVTARPPARLRDRVRDRLRVRHYSLRTEQACLSWTPRFILASGTYWVSIGITCATRSLVFNLE